MERNSILKHSNDRKETSISRVIDIPKNDNVIERIKEIYDAPQIIERIQEIEIPRVTKIEEVIKMIEIPVEHIKQVIAWQKNVQEREIIKVVETIVEKRIPGEIIEIPVHVEKIYENVEHVPIENKIKKINYVPVRDHERE